MQYWKKVLVAATQFINAVLGGFPDETTSSRAYRLQYRSFFWAWVRQGIDWLFFWQANHCMNAFQAEKDYRQTDPELREILDKEWK